ncbi:hypothetical protein KOI35_39525 [Actinoplanes bogorensis]|uniref:Uncharacterized protein n=1 Tax=Paractinoplanes bogorensis TaxID=1610840 RepID=A0ABS5Z3V2_9ACTN|nr:hypothetical protein [Actinoplanes bogorensis]MBU2669619.1 hypothetical protein [Actinoplanes bogorensis]
MQTSIVIVAVIVLVGFIAYLGLLAFVVTRTGDTRGLRDVALAVRAYRGVLAIVAKNPSDGDGAINKSDEADVLPASRGDLSPDR